MKKLISTLFVFVIAVNAFATPTLSVSSFGVTCFGACDGQAIVIPSGGIGPYGYAWSSGETTNALIGMCAGSYTVTVTDSSDMSTANAPVIISSPTALSGTTSSFSATCFGACDGQANILASGGTAGYTYMWMPGGITTASASSLCAGNYTVTVTDANGCSLTDSVSVGSAPAFTVSLSSSASTMCIGGCVNLLATPTGGISPYTYYWSPIIATWDSPTDCPVATTTYTVVVTDANGCTGMATTTVTVDPPMTTTMSSTATTACSSSCNGTAEVMTSGGSTPYMYLWNDPTGQTTQMATGLCNGTYQVTVVDMNGCMISDSVHVNNPHVACNYTMVPDSTNAFNFWAFNTSTGDSLSYIWYFGDGDSSFVQSPTHTYAATGTYNVCLIVSNPGGCFDVKCTTVNVTGILNSCMALFNIAQDTTTTDWNAHTVYNLSYGATLSYLWDFGDGVTSNVMNPTHVYSTPGSFEICLTVDNGSGCTQTFCDSIAYVDSLSRSGTILLSVVDMPFPYTVGVNEIVKKENSISVFPNPFSNKTTFEIELFKSNETYSFELIDVLGKKVKSIDSITDKTFTISRNGLQNGIYFYKIYESGRPIGIGKVIVK